METRKVTLYTTLGKIIKLETDASTWGDLRPLVNNEGIDTNEMRAMENKTKTSLEHDEAVLPEGPFTVFFTKINSKAGAEMSYKELRAKIKDLIDNHDAGNFFNVGKNYTNKSKDDLKSLLTEYNSSEQGTDAELEEENVGQPDNNEVASYPEVTAREALDALSRFILDELGDDHFGIDELDSIKDSLDMEEIADDDISLYLFGRRENISQNQETEEERAEREALEKEARSLGLM